VRVTIGVKNILTNETIMPGAVHVKENGESSRSMYMISSIMRD
jgi:hypothetical protein